MVTENKLERLKKAYTEENLNRIAVRIINAYRNKKFGYISALHRKINSGHAPDWGHGNNERINKIFALLILAYHPDRLGHYLQKIGSVKDPKHLDQYMHIFTALENLDLEVNEEIQPVKDIDFVPPEEYGLEETDFDYIIEEDENFEHDFYEESAYSESHDFLSTMALNEYGHNRFEIPRRDLENLTGMLDMSNQGIDDLNGIEACVNLTGLDLSNNELGDITDLGYLTALEELYLSGNTIMSVDSLMLLDKLKKLDLSFNSIDDLGPLIGLPGLEFLNAIGNSVPADQLNKLRKQGVVVIT